MVKEFNETTLAALEEAEKIHKGEIESKVYSSTEELFNDLGLNEPEQDELFMEMVLGLEMDEQYEKDIVDRASEGNFEEEV